MKKKLSPLVDAAPEQGASGERCSVAAGSALIIECPRWAGDGDMTLHRQRWVAYEQIGKRREVWDYGTRAGLTAQARAEKRPYEVIRHHRDGTQSVTESWPNIPVSHGA